MKKSITQLSEQELLDIIGSKQPVKVYVYPDDVMEFISVYNLKSGQEPVTTKLLYKLYTFWSKDPVLRRRFTHTLTDLFPSSATNKSVVILLDKPALNLKQEAYNYVKEQDKTKDKGWMEHFEKYLYFYSLKSGSFFIKDSVLYKLYSRWYGKKRRPLGFKQFNNFCKLYFFSEIIKKNYWFAVDPSIKNHLDEELIKEMRKKSADQKKKPPIRL